MKKNDNKLIIKIYSNKKKIPPLKIYLENEKQNFMLTCNN